MKCLRIDRARVAIAACLVGACSMNTSPSTSTGSGTETSTGTGASTSSGAGAHTSSNTTTSSIGGLPDGAKCYTGTQCTSGLCSPSPCCVSACQGYCGTPACCANGATCNSASDCCEGGCNPGSNPPEFGVGYCCTTSGRLCTAASDCCSGVCQSGTCS